MMKVTVNKMIMMVIICFCGDNVVANDNDANNENDCGDYDDSDDGAYVADDMVMLFLRSGEDGDDEDGGGR